MVLSTDELQFRTNDIIKNPHKFIVLDSEHIKYAYNNDRFVLAIELMNFCNSLNYGNEVFEKINPDQKINFDILLQAIGCVLKDEPFDNEQLLQYFIIQNKIDNFGKLMSNFTDLHENAWHPKIDLILLGISLKRQSELSSKGNCKLIEDYTETYEMYLDHATDLKTGIKKTQNKIKQYLAIPELHQN